MMEEIREMLAEILRREVPPLTPETSFEDLPGWDSVVHLSILMEAEHRFGLTFTAAQMIGMKTVGDLLALLEAKP